MTELANLTHVPLPALIGALAFLFLLLVIRLGLVVIDEDEAGLVVRRYGQSLPPGRIIATAGEAGTQARLLPPGWHFPLWRWTYKVEKVGLIQVPPGQLAVVVAKDGTSIPAERVLGREVACDAFQDAVAFLERGGEKGRQLAFLTAGTYRINPALFDVVTAGRAAAFGLTPEHLMVTRIPSDKVGIVTALDGRPIPAGDMAGPSVPGHDRYQRAQAFIAAGGCRGLQEEVLLSGAWNLNPWFVATSAWSSATSGTSTWMSPATASPTATSSSAAARACGSSRCCRASTR
jgi:uncharacterized membrane protein YqiK